MNPRIFALCVLVVIGFVSRGSDAVDDRVWPCQISYYVNGIFNSYVTMCNAYHGYECIPASGNETVPTCIRNTSIPCTEPAPSYQVCPNDTRSYIKCSADGLFYMEYYQPKHVYSDRSVTAFLHCETVSGFSTRHLCLSENGECEINKESWNDEEMTCHWNTIVCADGNECTTDTCVDEQCVHTPVADGTSCNDGSGTCQGGICIEGGGCTNETCDDGNLCTLDLCIGGVCQYFPTNDGMPCPSGFCVSGVCTFKECKNNADCIDPLLAPCTYGKCDVPIHVCSYHSQEDGTGCEGDDFACTVEFCLSGYCVSTGGTLPCPSDDNPCTTEVCSPTLGCVSVPVPEETPCTIYIDAGPSTVPVPYYGRCIDGTCDINFVPGVDCEWSGNCDDGIRCTKDICDETKHCVHIFHDKCCITDADCTDDNPCTRDICGLRVPNKCGYIMREACCVKDQACNDHDPDTVDVCYLPNNACWHMTTQPCAVEGDCAYLHDQTAPDCYRGYCNKDVGMCMAIQVPCETPI
jgi:hypothetical protein